MTVVRRTPDTTDRVRVAGTVRWIDPVWNGRGITYKMRVEDDRRFDVWVTVPKALWPVDIGDRVAFDARLDVVDPDTRPNTALASRPTNATRIDNAPTD